MDRTTIMTAAVATMLAGTAIAAPRVTRPAPAPAMSDTDQRVKMGVDAWQAGNQVSAVAIWRPLAEAGNPDAQYDLAQAYRLGQGVAPDMRVAMDWYRKAADQGHQQAQANYGLMLFQQGDQKGAMPMLRKAAEAGDPRAQYVVGTALFNGELLPKDWPRAYALMTRASSAGLAQASNSLAEMDKYIPLDQRRRGMQMAQTMQVAPSGISGPTMGTPAMGAPPPPAAPIRTVDLPPSAPPRAAPPRAAPPMPPAPPPMRRAPPPVAMAREEGGWRVQLGAFGGEGAARSQWEAISRRVGVLGGKQPFLVKVGAITRLQAGPYPTRAAAEKACVAVKAAGQDCFAAPGA